MEYPVWRQRLPCPPSAFRQIDYLVIWIFSSGCREKPCSQQNWQSGLSQLLKEAPTKNPEIIIRYDDGNGSITKRGISSISIKEDEINAFCHLRAEVRTFKIAKIIDITDLKTGNIERNSYKYFGLPGENINALLHEIMPAVKVLKLFSKQLRGFRERERQYIVDFIRANAHTNHINEDALHAWLQKVWCGHIDDAIKVNGPSDIYEFQRGHQLICQQFICEIPDSLMGECREVAMKITWGSGRKQVPPAMQEWIMESFRTDDEKDDYQKPNQVYKIKKEVAP